MSASREKKTRQDQAGSMLNQAKTARETAQHKEERRTNILYVKDSFAIIDSNEIVGQVYAPNTVKYTGVDDDSVASLQWTNPSTGETRDYVDMKQAYTNSVYGYGMAIGAVVFIFSFVLSALVNKVTKREPLEF